MGLGCRVQEDRLMRLNKAEREQVRLKYGGR